ncbi:collectin-10-like isoform X2 [Branchiostoma floridae]|uniref:Collectin-10-like isoform X2 n=1 Tax=Branchiostoma floridae TaxID=7739 RepID=A0A9J7M0U2_BRAFL|nr:collectin-10-like isoform X2 [Branchiostoma floridae]
MYLRIICMRGYFILREPEAKQTQQQCSTCPVGYTPFAEVCYKVFTEKKTYTDAQTHCTNEGGHLAMPKDKATNDLLDSLTSQASTEVMTYYFGLTFVKEKNAFKWNDGSDLVGFVDWMLGEPNNHLGGDTSCGAFCLGSWCDVPCSSLWGFVCQISAVDVATQVDTPVEDVSEVPSCLR